MSIQNDSVNTAPITARQMKFDFGKAPINTWCDGDIVKTAFLNGMSLALPLGEHYFIESVRHFEKTITNPTLRHEIKLFIAQEAIHSKQHDLYNQQLIKAGVNINPLIDSLQRQLDAIWLPATPLERLSYTVAIEHLTHILGECLMLNEQKMTFWDSEFKAFWLWHAAEEIEHKSVCYDIFLSMGGTKTMRYKALSVVISRMIRAFSNVQNSLVAEACRLNHCPTPSTRQIYTQTLKFFFGSGASEGYLKGVQMPLMHWFLPNYHPEQHKTRPLLPNWKATYLPQYLVNNLSI